MKARGTLLLAGLSLMLGACSATAVYPEEGVKPEFSFPVTTNETPYSVCLAALSRIPGNNLPVFSVGEVADTTRQINYDENATALTQGATEMAISALDRKRVVTGKRVSG